MGAIIIKPRFSSEKLRIYRSLNSRGKLSENERQYYWNLEKGFEGELMLDDWVRKLTKEFLVLNDMTFEFKNNEFQIDLLLIAQSRIYILDSKNFEGDYYYESNRFYKKGGTEAQDPLPQLRRCESLFRRMLQHLGFEYTFESYLVFVNPEFHLYQAPLDEPIIFPTQLKRFFKKLDSMPSKLNKSHYKLADKLMEIRLEKSTKDKIPNYHYNQLKKGFMCGSCYSLNTACEGYSLVCHTCGSKEKLETTILRSIEEFRLLFPERKITTKGIHEWCGGGCSNKRIRHVLMKHYTLLEHGAAAHFISKIIF